jgi:ribosomal protein L30E
MTVKSKIKDALKTGKLVIGTKKVKDGLKNGKIKYVIYATNCTPDILALTIKLEIKVNEGRYGIWG